MPHTFFRFTIQGVVQGVGFRPFIYRACSKAGLVGYVENTGTGVVVVVNDAETFRDILKQLPAHMRIDSVKSEATQGRWTDFTIAESSGSGFSEIPPDLFLCELCLAELGEKSNRRHDYFFLTCTACGPRFTLAQKSPYDRATTSMQAFALCPACETEYRDPDNRRFHAQTIACPQCGPTLTLLLDNQPLGLPDSAIFERVAQALGQGEIVAIKGVGGFHLFSSTQTPSIVKLNTLTGRRQKPYAVLCRDMAMARTLATPTAEEERQLLSSQRPIVLVAKTPDAPEVSELDTIGIMLASTALHMLLFKYYPHPLICTSANLAHAPLTTQRSEQFVPLVLDHDREIVNATDDSIIKVISEQPLLIRRSRGFVPESVAIRSRVTTPLLALGAEMNSTFALFDGHGRITLSQHLGNLTHPASFTHYQATLKHFLAYTHISPAVILCDLHPEYQTSIYGQQLAQAMGVPLISIQHHRAHAAGAALEHDLKDFTAIVCDGLGYGDDGTLWGGEVFDHHTRIGHLELHPQLGGDAAGRFPHRMLYSILRSFLSPEAAAPFVAHCFSTAELALLEKQFVEQFHAPLTSSCGRVLDAAAALLGICDERTYEGRPAMLLEALSTTPFILPPVIQDGVLQTGPLFAFLIAHQNEEKGRLAATVEHYLAEGLCTIAAGPGKPIVWAGGCAYNRLMSEYFLSQGVFMNKKMPPGDGGISFGQIAAYLYAQARDTGSAR